MSGRIPVLIRWPSYPTHLIYRPPPQQAVGPPTPHHLLTFLLAPLGLAWTRSGINIPHIPTPVILHRPAYEDGTDRVFRNSAFSTQTPGRQPKENTLHIEHGESLKSRFAISWRVQQSLVTLGAWTLTFAPCGHSGHVRTESDDYASELHK
jgi:hypothetical protein